MLIKKNLSQYLFVSGCLVMLAFALALNLHHLTFSDAVENSKSDINPAKQNFKTTSRADNKQSGSEFQHFDNEIKNRIQALESALLSLRAQLASNQGNVSDDKTQEEINEASDDPMKIERERTTRLVNYLDQHMQMEKVDADWNEKTKAEIAGALTDIGFISKVECHSTLCRIAAEHDNQESERDFIRRLTGLTAFINTDAFIERNEHEDGSVSTQIFIARSNHRLPDPGLLQ